MGFLSSWLLRCFCCDLSNEDQLDVQAPILFTSCHNAIENGGPFSQRLLTSSPSSESCSKRSADAVFIPRIFMELNRFPIWTCTRLHDQNAFEIQNCQDYIRDLGSISVDRLRDQNSVEFDECNDCLANSSTTDSQLKEVLISASSSLSCEVSNLHGTCQQDPEVFGLQCSLDSSSQVNKSGFVQVKEKDVCLEEKLHPHESIAKNLHTYLLEDLHFVEPKEKTQGGCLSDESIENKRDACLPEELHFEEPTAKKRDSIILVELHFEESIGKKKDECLPEELRFEESIEDVEEKEGKEVIKGVLTEDRWIKHYSNFQKILLVGEGDFSFSACLANAFGSASNMIATSLDSREFLRENYRKAITNIENLTSKGCHVIHGVNARKMAKNPLLKGMTFDRIIFNFPFAGFYKTEARESNLCRHQRLVSLFLKNAKEMINGTGEIHVTHKTNNFHCEWNIEHLASCHGLGLIEAVRFHHRDYPGYMSKCGFGGDNYFNCNPSKTYKFGPRREKQETKKVLWIARSNLDLQ